MNSTIVFGLISIIFPPIVLGRIVVILLRRIANATTNTVDDEVVDVLEENIRTHHDS